MKTHKAVGIYEREIFIAEVEDGKFVRFTDVLRPITASMLEDLRDAETYKDYCEDLWKCAVNNGTTELGLLDFAQECIDDADVDNDDEAFPFKDDSGLQYLDDEERKLADEFLLEHDSIEVGTWECSGMYAPNSFDKDTDKFKKFDFVFDKELAKQFYKTLK